MLETGGKIFNEAWRSEETWIGIAAAASLTGRDRTTIFRARKSGRLPVWANEHRIEAVRVSDLIRLYPLESWPDQSLEVINRQALTGRFEPIEFEGAQILAWRGERNAPPKPPAAQDSEQIAAAVRYAAERLAVEKAAGWRILSWAGAVSMLLVAISNLFVVAALARLAGLF